MNSKRGYDDHQFRYPGNKRSKYPEQDHQLGNTNRHPSYRYPPGPATHDPLHCAQHLEQLSIARDQPPPYTTQHSKAKPINLSNTEFPALPRSNQSRFAGNSHGHPLNGNPIFENGNFIDSHIEKVTSKQVHQPFTTSWTGERQGMQNKGNHNQPAFTRNAWNHPLTQPQLTMNKSQSSIRDRSIVNLPKRAPLLPANLFDALKAPPINEGSPPVQSRSGATQAKKMSKASKRKLKKSQKTCNPLVPVIIEDDKQIDIVLDTNIILSYMHFLRAVIPLLSPSRRLLIPQAVLWELDLQKCRKQTVEIYEAGRSSPREMGPLARQATNWLSSTTKANPLNVIIQKIAEESDELKKRTDADTRILSFAHRLFHQARSEDTGGVIVLLSNDNILRLRAQSEGICGLAMSDFHHNPREMMSQIRNFTPHPSVLKPLVPNVSTSLRPQSPVHEPSTGTSISSKKTNELLVASWVPSGKDAQFTFKSVLPNLAKPVTVVGGERGTPGPDKELVLLRYQIQKARPCMGCKSDIQSTMQVSPDKLHHYCPMCCEVICRGCMKVTGCDWDCSGPFYGKVCATMKCCAQGRAAMLLELLGQLDCCFITNRHKISFKDGPKISHLYGDEALTHYMEATTALLMTSDVEDERLGFFEAMLISSTLLDALSQTLLSSPLLKWHFRTKLFTSVINLLKAILLKLRRPWTIINTEYIKSSTSGAISQGESKIVWNKVIETSDAPNATSVKLDKLRGAFPSLMAEVKDVLCIRSCSSSTIVQQLLDGAVHVPLCYILENLFELSVGLENHLSTVLLDDIQIVESFPPGLVRLREALLALQTIYESSIISQIADSNAKANSSQAGGHKRGSSDSRDLSDTDDDDDDSQAKANDRDTRGRRNINHEVNLHVESRAQDDSEGDEDDDLSSGQASIAFSRQVIGTKARGREGGENGRTGQAQAVVGAADSPSTCPVTTFVEKIDTLSISSDENSASDDDTIEVIHLR